MSSSSLFGQKVYSLITDYAPEVQRQRKMANETGNKHCLFHDCPSTHRPPQGEEDHFEDDRDVDVGGDLYDPR